MLAAANDKEQKFGRRSGGGLVLDQISDDIQSSRRRKMPGNNRIVALGAWRNDHSG
jgi:hypothetical protein